MTHTSIMNLDIYLYKFVVLKYVIFNYIFIFFTEGLYTCARVLDDGVPNLHGSTSPQQCTIPVHTSSSSLRRRRQIARRQYGAAAGACIITHQQPEPKWINPPPPLPLPPSAAAPHTPLRLRQHCIAPAPPPAGDARPLARVGACMHVIGSGRARVERSHAGAGADRRAGRGRDDIYSKLLKLTSSRYLQDYQRIESP